MVTYRSRDLATGLKLLDGKTALPACFLCQALYHRHRFGISVACDKPFWGMLHLESLPGEKELRISDVE